MAETEAEPNTEPGTYRLEQRPDLRRAGLFWLAGLILLVAFAILLLRDGDSDGEPRPAVVENVQVGAETEQSIIQSASTPAVAVNPTNARNHVLGYRVERPAFSCAVSSSFDQGLSWQPSALSLPPGTERCYTTSLAFDRTGTLFLVFVTLAGPSNAPTGAWLTRSTDGGRTFQPATKVLEQEKFMVRLAVDPTSSPPRIYLTWVETSSIGLFAMAPPSAVMARASLDGGATFGQPVRVSAASRERVGAPVPVVGADGALHVVYYDYGKDVFDFQNLPGSYQGTFELVSATSRDRGLTFSEATVNRDVRPPEPFLVFTPPFPSATADRKSGALHVAWSDARGGQPAVLLATSDDQGRTWGAPRRVDDGSALALLPQISVADNGRLDVAYASVRETSGQPVEIRLTSSDDQGKTFGPALSLNQPFFRDLLPLNPRREAGRDLGSALGLASTDKTAFVAWADTRRGGTDTLRVDIVGAPVRINLDGAKRSLLSLSG